MIDILIAFFCVYLCVATVVVGGKEIRRRALENAEKDFSAGVFCAAVVLDRTHPIDERDLLVKAKKMREESIRITLQCGSEEEKTSAAKALKYWGIEPR